VKSEFRAASLKIARPVAQRIEAAGSDYFSSDCPMAGHQLASAMSGEREPTPPLRLLRIAYGI
jgi:hypothetical protein